MAQLSPEVVAAIAELNGDGKDNAKFAGKTIIYIIGGPGSGKGTQSERIIKNFSTGYMSAGDLLREEAKSGTVLGNFVRQQLSQGNILPQEITIGLLKREILRQDKDLYLIDGFPRKMDQAETFENKVCPCSLALMLDVPDAIMLTRLQGRSLSSGREDDTLVVMKKRIQVYHELSEPVFYYLQQKGKAVKIDGNRSPDAVFADIKALLTNLVRK